MMFDVSIDVEKRRPHFENNSQVKTVNMRKIMLFLIFTVSLRRELRA